MKNLDILFEDDQIIVVNKAAGMLSVPDRFDKDIVNIYGILDRNYDDIFIVHRLDRYTSGIIVFAKNAATHRALSLSFQDRKPVKKYLAIIDGVPSPLTGTINQNIAESMTTRGRYLVSKRGKESITEYEVIEDLERFSVVSLTLLTGRTHQIRVHMAYIDYPLLVDDKYGKRSEFMLSEIKGRKYRIGKDKVERPLLDRQSLHAHTLSFTDDSTGKSYDLESPLPKDMSAVIKQMRKIYKK